MTDPQGNPAPSGGFQNGGWYSGSQYWNGSFGAPNVINNPQQAGYQKPVSAEVVAQTNPANVQYLQSIGGDVPGAPPYTGNVQGYLDQYGGGLYGAASSLPGVQSFADIYKGLQSSGIFPQGSGPTPPNLVDSYKSLTEQAGIPAIQASITDLKTQQDVIAQQLQVNKTSERGKPVAQNVIEGRISTETQQAQDQYDWVGRQLARKQDEMTAALGNIKTIMDLTQQDYQNASAAYERQFTQAISMFNLIRGIQQDQKTDVQRAQDNARANAQIMVNSITNGNLSLSSMSPSQRAQLNTLEVQSGLPVGFFSSLRMDPKANIISTSTNNGVTQVLTRNPDGSISTQNYGTATGGVGGSTYKAGSSGALSTAISEMAPKITSKLNASGDISPANWNTALQAWQAAGFSKNDFVSNFGRYADTNRGDFQSAYGFKNPI